MKKLNIGLQFWPWYPVRTTVSYAETALKHYPFEQIWLCDEYQYTDPFTVLAIIAEKLKVSVGTLVTFVSRNPLYLAQKFASISELLPEGKEITAGFGPGGVVQRQVMLGHPASVEMTSEAVKLLRRSFKGEFVELAEFPHLAKRFGFNIEVRQSFTSLREREYASVSRQAAAKCSRLPVEKPMDLSALSSTREVLLSR